MKIKLLVVLGLLALASEAKPKKPGVVVMKTRNDVFCFKAKKRMLGGEVKVFDANNKLVAEQPVDSIINVVDFLGEKPGQYVIRISGQEGTEDFEYINQKHIPKK